jgi:hypothetical protein
VIKSRKISEAGHVANWDETLLGGKQGKIHELLGIPSHRFENMHTIEIELRV